MPRDPAPWQDEAYCDAAYDPSDDTLPSRPSPDAKGDLLDALARVVADARAAERGAA